MKNISITLNKLKHIKISLNSYELLENLIDNLEQFNKEFSRLENYELNELQLPIYKMYIEIVQLKKKLKTPMFDIRNYTDQLQLVRDEESYSEFKCPLCGSLNFKS